MLSSHHMRAQSSGLYATPGLYTVPAGGPHQIKLTAQGGDGIGGSWPRVGETFTAQSGDVVTLIVGQTSRINPVYPSNGGGGYGGGNGPGLSANAQGGYSYVSPAGSATTVTPGGDGTGKNRDSLVIHLLPNYNATTAITPGNRSICLGSPTTLQGTVSAKGSWTLVLSDGVRAAAPASRFRFASSCQPLTP